MGAFAEKAGTYQLTNRKLELIQKTLEDIDSESWQEFIEAIHDPFISCGQIATALHRTTGISVSNESVRRWRVGIHGNI